VASNSGKFVAFHGSELLASRVAFNSLVKLAYQGEDALVGAFEPLALTFKRIVDVVVDAEVEVGFEVGFEVDAMVA
jgi:hypothetical protein